MRAATPAITHYVTYTRAASAARTAARQADEGAP